MCSGIKTKTITKDIIYENQGLTTMSMARYYNNVRMLSEKVRSLPSLGQLRRIGTLSGKKEEPKTHVVVPNV